MGISESLNNLSQLIAIVSWTIVYALMMKRGLQDKSYGMPIVALAIDISSELYFTLFATDPGARFAYGPWFLINVGVLYTVYRYGRDDFEWPLLRRWFGTVVTLIMVSAFFLVYNFIHAFGDTVGALTASFGMLVYSTLLPVMLIRRNNLKGQSLYIALLILIGDTTGFITTLYAQAHRATPLPHDWLVAANVIIIPLHVLYVALVWWMARRDGINPWKRI